jgi:hypothetical protein
MEMAGVPTLGADAATAWVMVILLGVDLLPAVT